MSSRYEVSRSVADKSLHVISHDRGFEALPQRIRSLGPWQGLTGGEIERLKPHYRLQLAEQNFVVVYQHLASFSIER